MNRPHPADASRTSRLAAAAGGIAALLGSAPLFAHVGERAFLQLLPTGRYLLGGAAVVALTFALMAWLPARRLRRLGEAKLRFATVTPPRWPGAAVLVFLALLIVAGWTGSRDPLDNPLPTIIWSVWWAGFTVLHALFGNLWGMLSPWPALYTLLTAPGPLRWLRGQPIFDYPDWLDHWPAVFTLAAFAWLELVYPAPQDPARLAAVVTAYTTGTGVAMLLYGPEAWLRRGEAFTVFFRMVARIAPFAATPDDARPSRRRLLLRAPGAGLLSGDTPTASMTVFILLALSSVSFDGLSRTFWFVALAGGNPLEYPGRSILIDVNSAGMLATFATLAGGYTLAVVTGVRLAGRPAGGRAPVSPLRALVVSIIPIAFGYHLAHYLPYLIVDAQYALRALGDPFALGWNLADLRGLHVQAAFLSDHASVAVIWNAQVAAIVGAHMVAVTVAHVIAVDLGHDRRGALLSQAPMTALMIGYTLLGLWLLSTPAVG